MSNSMEQAVYKEMYKIQQFQKEKSELLQEQKKNITKIENDLKKIETFRLEVNSNNFKIEDIATLESLKFSALPTVVTLEMIDGLEEGLNKTKDVFMRMYKEKLEKLDKYYNEYCKILKDGNCDIFHKVAQTMVNDFNIRI